MIVFIKNIRAILRQHWLILVLAMMLTMVIAWPVISFPFVAGEDYQGINIPHYGTDAHLYLSRAKEALEGKGLGNVPLREGKDTIDPFFMYTERFLTAPFTLLGVGDSINPVTLYNVYNSIGVFILLLLLYTFVWQLSGNRWLSMAAALSVVGSYSIVYNKSLFYTDFNVYGRPMFPYISSLVTFLYLNLLVWCLRLPNKQRQWLAGFGFGILFYTYFYAWSFILGLNVVLIGLYGIKKDWKVVKALAMITGWGIVLGSYNLYHQFAYAASTEGQALTYFHWLLHTHQPVFSKIGIVTLLLFLPFAYWRKKDPHLWFIAGLIISGWLALNQQIITGKLLQYGHYYWYFIVPLSIIMSLYILWSWVPVGKKQTLFFIFLASLAFVNTAVGQYRSSLTVVQEKKYEQQYRPFIDRLNKEEQGVILAADSHLESLFTIFTNHDLFWQAAGPLYGMPIDRMKETLFVYSYLNKNSRYYFSGFLRTRLDHQKEPSMYLDLYQNLEGYWSGLDYYDYYYRSVRREPFVLAHREKTMSRLEEEYTQLVRDEKNINDILKKFGVNYLLWDRNRQPEWDLSFLGSEIHLLLDHNNISLYRIDYD